MYKNAAKLDESFLNQGLSIVPPVNPDPIPATEEAIKQKLSLERDMEEALQRNIADLEPALKIIDEGTQLA